ncbi:hypothetical protein [Corynebacterium pelargi]|uniref:Uncharacterized protein n=1 Tax=Corynebacterium pelargi TaxID=1471400 RepID=A0A410WA88_9CORY|nr:hypothetical protein [Corynebacterium pelargi]QAU52867.1 hypothetical protein CPELA_08055 [Corynebacterium pelargi]GGG76411.1 hypothetical protein GCM10007338_12680 [Corynebacterium pelargi]
MNYKEAYELVLREYPDARINTKGYEAPDFFVLPPEDPECEGFGPYFVWKNSESVDKSHPTDPRIDEWMPLFIDNPVSV